MDRVVLDRAELDSLVLDRAGAPPWLAGRAAWDRSSTAAGGQCGAGRRAAHIALVQTSADRSAGGWAGPGPGRPSS